MRLSELLEASKERHLPSDRKDGLSWPAIEAEFDALDWAERIDVLEDISKAEKRGPVLSLGPHARALADSWHKCAVGEAMGWKSLDQLPPVGTKASAAWREWDDPLFQNGLSFAREIRSCAWAEARETLGRIRAMAPAYLGPDEVAP